MFVFEVIEEISDDDLDLNPSLRLIKVCVLFCSIAGLRFEPRVSEAYSEKSNCKNVSKESTGSTTNTTSGAARPVLSWASVGNFSKVLLHKNFHFSTSNQCYKHLTGLYLQVCKSGLFLKSFVAISIV